MPPHLDPITTLPQLYKAIQSLRRKDDGHIYITDAAPLIAAVGVHHDFALALWHSGGTSGDVAHREIAVRIADPALADEALLESWVAELDEWGLTDSFTGYVVKYTRWAEDKAFEWADRAALYQRRAGFATIAQMAWTRRYPAADDMFIRFLPLILRHAPDSRLHVKKAVNWALRDIGKRNALLCAHAIETAKKLQSSPDKTARWVGTHRCGEFIKAEIL